MAVHRIAVVQFCPKASIPRTFSFRSLIPVQPLDVEFNHDRACAFIREAAARGAILAVLPE